MFASALITLSSIIISNCKLINIISHYCSLINRVINEH